MMNLKCQKQSGFTLLEAMLVVGLVAVLAMWGVPNFGRYTAKTQVNNAISQVAGSIKMARSQAMATGRQINLCGLMRDGSGNYSDCSGTPNNWSTGWGVVTSDGTTSTVLQVYEVTGELQITASGNVVVAPNGMRVGGTGGAIAITVSPTNFSDGTLNQSVTINSASLSYKIN